LKTLLRSWNCRNCGRRNKTLVAQDGTAKCEYCTDVAEVRPIYPGARKLFRFASNLLSSLTSGSVCLRWRPVPVPPGRGSRAGDLTAVPIRRPVST
jgi:hypothetical protein